MGGWQGGDPLPWRAIDPRRNRRTASRPAAGGRQAQAAATAACSAASQPPMAKTLSTNAAAAADSAMRTSCGNGGAVESVEIQKQDFPSSHRSLGISQTARDSHIPTAPATRPWKSGKPNAGFPLSHSHLYIWSRNKNRRLRRRRKGDISIEVRMGTFLTRLDILACNCLTI